MNNEPVAWIVRTFDADKGKTVEAIWDFKPINTIGCTPLYTHPADLTDEEIEELWYDPRFIGDPVAFGKAVLRAAKNIPLQTDEEICKKCDALTERAILRKAQENE